MRESLTRPTPLHSRGPGRVGRAGATLLTLALIILALNSGYAQEPKPKKFGELIPEQPPAGVEIVPNPLSLTVEIDAGGKLKLNGEVAGTVAKPGRLARRLKAIFAERERKHVYAPGMETRTDLPEKKRVAKAVFLKAPAAAKYSDVVRVVDAIKGAGGDPIGLEIDDTKKQP